MHHLLHVPLSVVEHYGATGQFGAGNLDPEFLKAPKALLKQPNLFFSVQSVVLKNRNHATTTIPQLSSAT